MGERQQRKGCPRSPDDPVATPSVLSVPSVLMGVERCEPTCAGTLASPVPAPADAGWWKVVVDEKFITHSHVYVCAPRRLPLPSLLLLLFATRAACVAKVARKVVLEKV